MSLLARWFLGEGITVSARPGHILVAGPGWGALRPYAPGAAVRVWGYAAPSSSALAERLAERGLPGSAAVVRDLAGAGHAHGIAAGSDAGIAFYTEAGPDGAASALARRLPSLAMAIPAVHGARDAAVTPGSVLGRLAALAGAPAPTERQAERIAGLLWPAASPAEVAALLSLPPEHRPLGPGACLRERAAFRAIVAGTAPLAAALGHWGFLRPARGRWQDLRERATVPGRTIQDAVHLAIARAESLARDALLPAVLSLGMSKPGRPEPRHAERDALLCLVEGKGLAAILRAVDGADSPGPAGRWPAAFPDFDAGGGIRVTCLADAIALSEEGSALPDRRGVPGLDHCVGGYAGRCAAGTCAIVSVRGPDGGRLSTAQLDPGGWDVVEHKGLRNGPPPEAAAQAIAAFLAALGSGALRPEPAWLAAGWRRSATPPEPSADPAAAEAGLAAWRPFLPRPLRTREALAARWSKVETPRPDPGSPTAGAADPKAVGARPDSGARDVGMALMGLACLPALVVAAGTMAADGRWGGSAPPDCLARRGTRQAMGALAGACAPMAVAANAFAEGKAGAAIALSAWTLASLAVAAAANRDRLAAWTRGTRQARAVARRARGVASRRVEPGGPGRSVYDRAP